MDRMSKTNIPWATHTWNPVTGCTPLYPECEHCYAKSLHDKRHKAYKRCAALPPEENDCFVLPPQYARPFSEIQFLPERLDEPSHWRKPANIFVVSMGDLFHADVNDGQRIQIFDAMTATPRHNYLLLTKRFSQCAQSLGNKPFGCIPRQPRANWFVGFTAGSQATFDAAWPHMRRLGEAGWKVWLSCEPMIGKLVLPWDALDTGVRSPSLDYPPMARLAGVVCGGESGPGARPMHPDWARSLRDECAQAGVSFYFKQWGVKRSGRLLDGREHNELAWRTK
jgi:protein gp37